MDMMAELEKIYQAAEMSAEANSGSKDAATVVRLIYEFKSCVESDIKFPTVALFDVLRKG